ncbi:MAG TPA: sugar ABC transporter ATP-binding protein [Candidatus Limiplasma sp.]|nr:sugar ABC transporter ATP-binding protein [Candidatus Limiplasma sp.]
MEKLLEVKDISKSFPGVKALRGVSFDVYAGEVHALIGENGAGKSTLIKILAGVYGKDDGEYLINGEPANINTPLEAIQKGVSVIYQEMSLCPNISVAENIYLTRLPRKRNVFVDKKKLIRDSKEMVDKVGLAVDVLEKVENLSTAQKQLVEIARSISVHVKVIIMDEPTSALSPTEIQALFDNIQNLKKRGIGIIYVSHKLEELEQIADRITVLRDGEHIATSKMSDMSRSQLIKLMVGREVESMYSRVGTATGETVLEVKKLNNEKLKDVSFYLKKGEIVGFSGLMGAGKTEVAKALFGFDHCYAGEIILDGKKLQKNSTDQARKIGLGFVPEDRKLEGIFTNFNVRKNLTLCSIRNCTKDGVFINRKLEYSTADRYITGLKIKTPGQEEMIENLSGGNQQKVILSRWLSKTDTKVLIVDEPTRGIDVGAKAEIYAILGDLAQKGMAILMMSSEIPELLGVCNRIYVMKDGMINAEYDSSEATPEKLLASSIQN